MMYDSIVYESRKRNYLVDNLGMMVVQKKREPERKLTKDKKLWIKEAKEIYPYDVLFMMWLFGHFE